MQLYSVNDEASRLHSSFKKEQTYNCHIRDNLYKSKGILKAIHYNNVE